MSIYPLSNPLINGLGLGVLDPSILRLRGRNTCVMVTNPLQGTHTIHSHTHT
uniref:Uncharacterized protein n=1 Tax=Anguilla anguilla TaxID=7936 RepID=A0A0E9QAG6_ANGAN